METPKNTGLGSSLLLRRTVPSPVPSATPIPVVPRQEVTPAPEVPNPRQSIAEPLPIPPIQVPQNLPKQPLVLRDKCTLYLEREVNEQLHMAARIEGRDRSEIVTDILRKHLPTYRIERQE